MTVDPNQTLRDGGTRRLRGHVLATCAGVALLAAGCGGSGEGMASGGAGESPSHVSTHERELAEFAANHGLQPGDIEEITAIREVTFAESQDVHAHCMTGLGFAPASRGASSLTWTNIAPEQQYAYNVAHYTCQAQYPLAERYRRAPTRAQQELIYHHLIEEAVPCLEARGYSTAPPSSLDTFLEAAPGERWDPYVDGGIDRAIEADVLNGTLSDYSEIYHLCPPLPPDDVYYAEH